MIELTNDDVTLSVAIGDRVRRALIRHFVAFIKAKIVERGFTAEDPELFDQDEIEGAAWRLAAEVLDRACVSVDDWLHNIPDQVIDDPAGSVRTALAEELPEVEREFLDDQLGGLNLLIMRASGNVPEIR